MNQDSKGPLAVTQLSHTKVFTDPHFRLRVMRVPKHSPGGLHSHAFHELVVILDGRAEHQVDRMRYKLEGGDTFVILGDTAHRYTESTGLYLVNILFDPDHLGIPRADIESLPGYHALFTVEPRMRRRGNFKNRLRLDADQLAHAAELIAAIEEEIDDRNHGYRYLAIAHLMQLIGYLSRCYSQLDRDEARPINQLSEVLGYMERHYAEPLTVADLTQVAGMSQTSLMRKFKEILGCPPVTHLIRLRIAKARRLLRHTSMTIGEVAFDVGFQDSNYFSRQFRQVTGVSPRRYRERQG